MRVHYPLPTFSPGTLRLASAPALLAHDLAVFNAFPVLVAFAGSNFWNGTNFVVKYGALRGFACGLCLRRNLPQSLAARFQCCFPLLTCIT